MAEHFSKKVQITPPAGRLSDQENLDQEVRKYLRLIPTEPEPNLGRVREIKEEIKKGNYPTQEMIEETARQLAVRLSRTEE